MAEVNLKRLNQEMLERFPERADQLKENAELPYLQMHEILYWLEQFSPSPVPASAIERVAAFWEWCQNQESGQDAGDDIFTIATVGFFEKLFQTDATRALLPHLVDREHLLRNADYLKKWAGADNYDKALALYGV